MKNIFTKKNWYKGNLHTHTTQSDGLKSPDEAILLYRERGYDFLSITDHYIYTGKKEYEDFVLLSGIECHDNEFTHNSVCHITGVGGSDPIKYRGKDDVKEIIKYLKKTGAFVSIAHPAWSLMSIQSLFDIKDYDAIEIYNDVSYTNSGRGHSDVYVDVLTAGEKMPLITSVDDVHFYDKDGFKGYIMVNADALNNDEIMKNIKEGNFYASTGFDIKNITLSDNTIEITFYEDAYKVDFLSNVFYSKNRCVYGPAKKVSYNIMDQEKYIRVVAQNKDGDKAYSQFIYPG